MMDFKVQNVVPPGGRYFYEVPGLPGLLTDFTLDGVVMSAAKQMRDNNIPVPPDLHAVVKDFMCHRLPLGFCHGSSPGDPPVRVYTLGEIRENTRIAVQQAGGFVAPGEARRRALVCVNCPKNDRSACPTCVGLVAWAVRAVGGRDTGYSQTLGVCGETGLALPAMVHLPDCKKSDSQPTECWRK